MATSTRDERVVLVTGGTGLVGHGIQWAIRTEDDLFGRKKDERWVFLSSRDGDLREYQAARRIFETNRPSQVIHLAARVGGMFENMQRPAEFVADNLAIDQNILRLCHEFKVQKLVSCLSTCIFPDKTPYPINETMLHDGPPHDSNFAYAHAKRMIEVSSRAYRSQYDSDNFITVIPTNIYGPHDNFGEGCHFVPSIIKRVVAAEKTTVGEGGGGGGGKEDEKKEENKGKEKRKIVVPGTGKAMRQFIYSRDLARLMILALRRYDDGLPLILSVDAEEEVSIRDVVEMVCRLVDGGDGDGIIEVDWDSNQSDGQLRKTADNSRMRGLLGEVVDDDGGGGGRFEFTSLERGLAESIEWYKENKLGSSKSSSSRNGESSKL